MSEVSKELAIELEVTGESGYSVEAVPSLVPFNTNSSNIVTEVSTQKSVTVYGRVGRNARQAGTITSYTLPTGFVADSSTNGTLVFHAGNDVSLATSSNVTINFTFDGLAFSVVVPLVPSKAGQAGVDADNTEWIYKYDASGYAGSTGQVNPSGEASGSDTNKQQDGWVPNGWYNHALAISASNTTVYASYRVKDGSTHQFGAFQTPIEWSHWGRNGQDGDGTEYVFVRTKEYVSPKPVVPTQEQSSTYCEENNNYNVDEHVPYVRVVDTYDISGSTSPVPSGGYKYVKCTDDPVGTDSTWQYEWVLKRTKEAPDATGARAWEKYSSYMSLWTNYAESIEKTGVDELYYAVTDSGQDHPAENSTAWKSTKAEAEAVKPWAEDKIMWTKTVVNWSDGSHTVFYSGDRNPNDGDEGTSISIASQSVMYAKRDKDHAVSDPSTLQESEWSLNYPATLNQGDWLYTRTTVNYQDSDGHSAGSTVTYGASNIGQNGNPGKGISAVTEHYITSDKNYGEAGAPVTPTDGTDWTTNPNVPDQQGQTTWNETNKYLWNYEKTTYTQGNPTRTDARVIAIWTEDGKGIDSIVNRYLTNNVSSGITKSNYKTYNNGNEWPSTITPISASAPYLWNFEVIAYTDGDSTMTDPHVIGHFGVDGNGIVSITRTFAISSVGTTASETTEPSHYGSWSVSSPTVTKQYPYLWAKEVTVFTDTTKNTTKYYCIGARGDNGVDAQDIEWVFIRTKTPTAPTILNDNTYVDSHNPGRDYTKDGHLPHVSGNANIENNQNTYECTDDPKGVNDEWLYEWEIKRTKGVANAGARAWNYYTGSMTLHNNFAESAFIIDIDNDNDQFGTDSDSKVPVQQTRSTKVTLYDGAAPQTLKTLTATLKYEDSTSVPTSVATVACTKSTGVVAVTVLQNNTPNSHTEIQAHISATDTKDRQKTITFTLYKIMSGQPGLTPIIYNVEPTVKSLVFNRDASNNLTPPSRSSQINVARTEGNTTTTISSATTGLTYSWGFEDEATATNAHSGLAIGTSISVSNSDAASHSSVWVLLSTGDKETLSIVKDGAKGDSITKSSEVKAYKVSDSGTTTPTGTWYSTRAAANTAYAWTAKRYMWTRTTITWSDTTTTVLYSAELKPDDGEQGMSISIASQSITYSKQTSGNVDPTTITNWGSYPSSLSKGDWLYSKTTVNYQNSQGQSAGSTNSYAVSYIGTDGSAGAAGRGITGVYEHYKASANATGETTPTSSSSDWGTNPSPSDWSASKPYLWNYERITYSKGTTTERTTASVIAVWTENGKGVDSITNFYKKSNKATGVGYPANDPDGGGTAHSGGTETGWSAAVQAPDATDQYLWNYERVKWIEPNGTYSYTYTGPHVIGHFGKDGKGITLDTAKSSISYAFSSYGVAGSGRSYPSDITSWSSSVPTAQQGKYLWTKDVTAYKYSDGASAGSTTTYGVSYYATDGDSVEIDTSRTNVRYSTQKTASQPADSTFTRTTPPTLAQGDYLWCRSQTAYVGVTDALKSYSVSRVGVDGSEGDPGADGYTTHFAYATSSDGSQNFSTTNFSGATYIGTYRDQKAADSTTYTDYVWTQWKGDSITRSGNDTYRYATNNTGTRPAASSSSWSTTKPMLNKGYWLYTETTVHWSDGSTTVFYTDERNPNDGQAGMDIVAGTTTIQYKLTETNVQPTSGWGNYPSTLTQGWYLWSKATTPYYKGQVGGTSAGESVTYNVSYIAEDGDAGRSITSVSEYYKASNKSSGETAPSDDSGWSTNPNTAMQSWNQTNKYLWNYEKVTYSSGTTVERSTPAIIAIWTKDGAAGKGIDSITNYYKCTNSTTAPSRAHEGGTGWQTSPVAPDSTNQYLWNYEAITWVNPSGTTYTGVQMIGHYGKDGTSPYVADLTNEMDSISCDDKGAPVSAQTVYTVINMYYGSSAQLFGTPTVKRNGTTMTLGTASNGVTASYNSSTKKLSIAYATTASISGKDLYEISITATGTSVSRTLTFTVNGIIGDVYNLLPAETEFAAQRTGNGGYVINGSSTITLRGGYTKNVNGTITTVESCTDGVVDSKYYIFFRRRRRSDKAWAMWDGSQTVWTGDYPALYERFKSGTSTLDISTYDAIEMVMTHKGSGSTGGYAPNDGIDAFDSEKIYVVADGLNGVDAVTIDLTNENDSMLYDSFGTLKSGNVTSEAKLYKGTQDVSNDATWSVVSSKTNNVNDCTVSNATSRNITITAMAALKATVTVTASYGGKTYTAVLSLKKLVNEEKYELDIDPSAIAYNTTTSQPSSVTITAKIWKTAVDGTRALSTPPSGYRLYARANNGSGSILSWTDTNTLSLSVNPNSYSAVFVILEKQSGEQIILDSETIPITKTQNGANGDSPVNVYTWNIDPDTPPTISGTSYPPSGWSTTIPNNPNWAIVQRDSFTTANWNTYGTVGHNESWGNTSSTRGNVKTGNWFMVTGKATDAQLYHVLFYQATNDSGNLVGNCMAHYTSDVADFDNYLWQSVSTKHKSGSGAITYDTWGNPARISASGTSPYVADLDNEMDSVACDKNGKPKASTTCETNISLFYGSSKTSFKITGITKNNSSSMGTGVTVKIDNATPSYPTSASLSHKVSVTYATTATISTKDDFAITITDADGNNSRTLHFTINGVREGASGEPAIVYSLVPTCNEVVKKKDGSYVPSGTSKIGCTVLKTTGTTTSEEPIDETDEYIAKYSLNGGSETAFPISGITVNTITSNLVILLYDKNGSILLDKETIPLVTDGTDGIDAVTIDLTNENDSIIYDAFGTKKSADVTSEAKLYVGTQDKTSAASWTITPSGCTVSSGSSTSIVVDSMTALAGTVTATASYGGKNYSAVLSVKKLINEDKYELEVTPNAIAYNSTTNLPSSQNVSVNIWKTSHTDGSRAKSNPPTGYNVRVYANGQDSATYYAGTKSDWATNPYVFTITPSTWSSCIVALNNASNLSSGSVLDSESIPITKTLNGAAGKNAIHLALDNEHEDFIYSASGKVAPTSITSRAHLYNGQTEVTSGISWAIDQNSSSTSGISYSDVTFTNGLLTVNGITADTAKITVQATYNSNVYKAVFTSNKTIQDKYDIIVNPDSIKYDPTTYVTQNVNVSAKVTTLQDGQSDANISLTSGSGTIRLFRSYKYKSNELFSSLTAGGNTQVSSNTIVFGGSNTDTYFYVNTNENIVAGEVYTVSFTVSGWSGSGYWDFCGYQQSNSAFTARITGNGLCSCTGVLVPAGTSISTPRKIIFDDAGVTASRTMRLTLSNFSFVKATTAPTQVTTLPDAITPTIAGQYAGVYYELRKYYGTTYRICDYETVEIVKDGTNGAPSRTNILRESRFESFTYWSNHVGSVTANAYNGYNGFTITQSSSAGYNSALDQYLYTNGRNWISPSTIYTLSFWLNSTASTYTYIIQDAADTSYMPIVDGVKETSVPSTYAQYTSHTWGSTGGTWVYHTFTFKTKSSFTNSVRFLFGIWETGSKTATICMPKLELGENASGYTLNEAELEGKGYKAVVNRDGSFTEALWNTYATIGRYETWGSTSTTRGDCKTGDWFIVVGKSSDTGDYHTATFECDNDSGDLHGKCIAHQITQNAFEFNVTPTVMQWSTNSSGTLTNWTGQSGTATAYKGSKSLTPSSLSITNLPLGFVPTFSSSGGFTITPVQNYTSFYNSSGSPTTIYVMKAQNGGIASGDKVYNSSMVAQSGTITSVTSSTGYATAVVWNSKTYSYSSAASTSLANPVNAIVSCTAAGATRTLSVTISPAKQGAQGIQGIQGKMGRNPYFWGVWSEKGSSETFTVTDYMTAYVQTNEPWAEIPTCYMFVGANGSYTKTTAGTPSSTSTNWKLMTSDFEYLITKAIFSGFAKLGSGIFNEDYAFSQYGRRNGSRSKRYEYFMPNGGVMTGSLAGTTPSNPVVLGTFSAAETSYSFNIEFDVASSANYAGITTNPTGTWAYSWNENSTSYTKTASSLTVGQKYYVVAGRAQGTATKAKVTCTTNVFTPNLYIDWLNGEIYSQLGRFVNVTIEGVLNNLSINITESNYSKYGSRSGSGQPFWLDPTKVGNIVTYRCNSPLGLPSAWYEGGPDVYNISSGGVSITLDQLRQCIGKKIYLYTFSNTSMQSFYCGINGNGMFVYETDHITLNQITSTSDKTETVKYNRVYQYASQQSLNNSFFIFECKLGEYNNHECIYWGITRSAYRMDYAST